MQLLIHCRFSHDQVDCLQPCTRVLACGHPCTEPCHADCKSNCECHNAAELEEAIEATVSSPEKLQADVTHPASSVGRAWPDITSSKYEPPSTRRKAENAVVVSRPPKLSSLVDLAPVMSNKNTKKELLPLGDLTGRGPVQPNQNPRVFTERENLELRQKRLDDETFAALFGDPSAPSLTERIDNVNLVRTRPDGEGGKRGLWTGTFEVPQSDPIETKEKDDLLDLF